MTKPPEAITRQDAKEALLRSGYLLEYRLESFLRANAFYVEASAPVPDPITGVSREMDLYAMTGSKVQRHPNWAFAVLLIECVNNPQPVAFITKEPTPGAEYFHTDHIKLAGYPTEVPVGPEDEEWDMRALQDYLNMQEYHHYCRGNIATQWCSFSKKKSGDGKGEWFASHDDQHHNDFGKLATAVDYYSRRQGERSNHRGTEINLELYYPVLVVQGELLEVRPSKRSLRLAQTSHVKFCRSVVRDEEERTYQIDVVTERFFTKYLDMVLKELETTAERLAERRKEMLKALKASTPEKGTA
jgi:hypothetical protein